VTEEVPRRTARGGSGRQIEQLVDEAILLANIIGANPPLFAKVLRQALSRARFEPRRSAEHITPETSSESPADQTGRPGFFFLETRTLEKLESSKTNNLDVLPVRDRIKALRRVRARELAPTLKNWRRHP